MEEPCFTQDGAERQTSSPATANSDCRPAPAVANILPTDAAAAKETGARLCSDSLVVVLGEGCRLQQACGCANLRTTKAHSPSPAPVARISPSDIPTFDLPTQAEYFREWLQRLRAYEDITGILDMQDESRRKRLRLSVLRYSLTLATLKQLDSISEGRGDEVQDPDKMVESLANLVEHNMEQQDLFTNTNFGEGLSKRVKREREHGDDERLPRRLT